MFLHAHAAAEVRAQPSSPGGVCSVRNTVSNPEGPAVPFERAAILEQEGKVVTLINPNRVRVHEGNEGKSPGAPIRQPVSSPLAKTATLLSKFLHFLYRFSF